MGKIRMNLYCRTPWLLIVVKLYDGLMEIADDVLVLLHLARKWFKLVADGYIV